ncbi:PIG-L family deacetylase [Candidatus Woesearchaeota archaeon]|nr:PIG-L family deacetylase [Candidatus Woesearchaeota archaeon]
MRRPRIVVFTAHDDDNVFGLGGTLIKYIGEGHDVTCVIFSYGESSNILLKKNITKGMRKKEWLEVSRFIGVRKTVYFGLEDMNVDREIRNKQVLEETIKVLRKTKPDKVFTHSANDAHPDHKAVHSLVLEAYDGLGLKSDLYTFDVWTPFRKSKDLPEMYVDITGQFRKKLKAIFMFRSQRNTIFTLMTSVYWKAFYFGLKNHCRWAEKFYKER